MTHYFIAPLVLLWLLFSQSLIAKDINLPSLGSGASSRFSEAEEKLLGDTFMRQVRLELPISNDPEVTDYISHLGFQLLSNSDFRSRNFSFFVVNDPNINAFAGPNGYIGINAGLVLNTEDESELASVVAHEIAHVTQRHLERSFDTQDSLSLPTAAAIITAIVLGSQTNINITEAAIFATIAANYQTQLSFSRAHELEADHVGMQILTKSRFDPHSMPSFFEKLQQASRLGESPDLEFLSTHPVTVRRISESRNRATQYEFTPNTSSANYYLTKANLRVMTSDNHDDLVKRLAAELKEGSYQNKAAQLYSYALALLETKQLKLAREQVNKVIALDRERIQYLILKANIEIADENLAAGYKIFSESLELNPGNPAISLHFADALINNSNPAKAKSILTSIKNYQKTPLYYQLMAKAEGDSGNPSGSHRMLAEYYLMFDQIPIAINHLRQAIREKDVSDIERQRIQTRIEEIKEIAILEKQF